MIALDEGREKSFSVNLISTYLYHDIARSKLMYSAITMKKTKKEKANEQTAYN